MPEEKHPAVSVIVPFYNAQESVAAIVGALQVQTCTDFEALLVDDGSTDNTLIYLNAAVLGDDRFRVLTQENAGPGVARNAGIDAATGDYITFMDCDDTPDMRELEIALAAIRKADADIAIWQSRQYDNRTGRTHMSPDRWEASAWPEVFDPRDHAARLFGAFRNWPWDKMFRREFLNEQELRFPALRRTEDLPFVCGALASASRIALINKELYTYHVGAESSSTQTLDRAPLDFYEACRAFHDFLIKRDLWDTYRESYLQWAGLCVHVNMLGLQTPEGFAAAYKKLHSTGLKKLGLANLASTKLPTSGAKNEEQNSAPAENAGIDAVAADDAASVNPNTVEMKLAEIFGNERVAHTIKTIEELPASSGTFVLLREEADFWRESVATTQATLTFRLGEAVLAPAKAIRDNLRRRQ